MNKSEWNNKRLMFVATFWVLFSNIPTHKDMLTLLSIRFLQENLNETLSFLWINTTQTFLIKTFASVACWIHATPHVNPAPAAHPPPSKLKQGGQKDIFQFSRCESFHLVIQMSLVFCVNRCPFPASFINISWLGFSMQLALPVPHRY